MQNSDWIISFILLGKQWELLSGKSVINEEIRSELQRKAKKEDILLTLKMGHRAKNKIFGEYLKTKIREMTSTQFYA